MINPSFPLIRRCVFLIFFFLLCFFIGFLKSVLAEEEPLKASVAQSGYITRDGKQIPFFEISGSEDIPVDQDQKPQELPNSVAQDQTREYEATPKLEAPAVSYTETSVGGQTVALGIVEQLQVDLKKAYEEGDLQKVAALQAIIDAQFPSDPNETSPITNCSSPPGPVILSYDGVTLKQLTWSSGSIPLQAYASDSQSNRDYYMGGSFKQPVNYCGYVIGYAATKNSVWAIKNGLIYRYMGGEYTYTQPNPNTPPIDGAPDTLNDEQENELAETIADLTETLQEVRQAIDEVVKNKPSLLEPGTKINSGMISKYASSKASDANDSLIDTLQGLVDANPGNIDAETALEKAKADAAKDEAEELKQNSYGPIANQGFDENYSSGEDFDIPQRASDFMDTVKTSNLFGFSSSFFSSLPGGGSPVYEIDAGLYGQHTVDLSQTMSTGLAVLKTILLLCFSFLSIRAIIMKR